MHNIASVLNAFFNVMTSPAVVQHVLVYEPVGIQAALNNVPKALRYGPCSNPLLSLYRAAKFMAWKDTGRWCACSVATRIRVVAGRLHRRVLTGWPGLQPVSPSMTCST